MMPLLKRPYRPKVKGCYECSQRRISCDRTGPQCGKCHSKGLDCSGFDANIRYRFTEGVTTRGKWAGETTQSRCERRQIPRGTTGANSSAKEWPKQPNTRRSKVAPASPKSPQTTSDARDLGIDSTNLGHDPESPPGPVGSIDTYLSSLIEVSEHGPQSLQDEDKSVEAPSSEIQPSPQSLANLIASSIDHLLTESLLDDIPSWEKSLLLHYSEHIAGEMIAIDGTHNGWRFIVLPMAHTDKLVMNAVLAVSAFHWVATKDHGAASCLPTSVSYTDTQQPCWTDVVPSPQALYDTAIEGLRQRSNLSGSSNEERQAILVAVLVLLVAAMVTGRDDYSIILGMLCSATNVFGGEHQLETSELGGFLVRQVRKMRVYAAPYISELAGLETLTSQSRWDQYFDCVRHCCQSRPENATAVAAITDVMQQAHDIYLQGMSEPVSRGDGSGTEAESIGRIEHFKKTLEKLPADGPGTHVLVWATFLVAAASSLESHRVFFKGALLRHYSRSRFANLLRGMNHLPHIWAKRDRGVRWTQLLSEARLFLM